MNGGSSSKDSVAYLTWALSSRVESRGSTLPSPVTHSPGALRQVLFFFFPPFMKVSCQLTCQRTSNKFFNDNVRFSKDRVKSVLPKHLVKEMTAWQETVSSELPAMTLQHRTYWNAERPLQPYKKGHLICWVIPQQGALRGGNKWGLRFQRLANGESPRQQWDWSPGQEGHFIRNSRKGTGRQPETHKLSDARWTEGDGAWETGSALKHRPSLWLLRQGAAFQPSRIRCLELSFHRSWRPWLLGLGTAAVPLLLHYSSPSLLLF